MITFKFYLDKIVSIKYMNHFMKFICFRKVSVNKVSSFHYGKQTLINEIITSLVLFIKVTMSISQFIKIKI